MKLSMTKSSIEWLSNRTQPPIQNCINNNFNLHTIPKTDDMVGGHIETLKLRIGMLIARGVHHFTPEAGGKMVPLAEFESVPDEPTLVIHSLKKGHVLLKDDSAGVELLFDQKTTVFQFSDHLKYTPILSTNNTVVVSVLHVGVSALNLFLGKEETDNLFSKLNITKVKTSKSLRVPIHISEILHSAMDNKMEVEIRRLYGQAKCIEYFVALIDYLKTTKVPTDNAAIDSRVEQIAEELIQLEGKIPNMTDIATHYGTSLKNLNNGFRRVFNTTLYGYLTDCRLKRAHKKLQEENFPMKAISAELGYSHVNHFITAFKKKFGYTPGSLKRNQSL